MKQFMNGWVCLLALVICVVGSVSAQAVTLYGGNQNGDIFTIDTSTGVGTAVGSPGLFGGWTEIEYDNINNVLWGQLPNGTFEAQEIDINTGLPIGPGIFNAHAFNGLEYVGPILYGAGIDGPQGGSTLYTLDPGTGASVSIGLTGVGPISGLAYDEVTNVMYGVDAGGVISTLYTLNLGTGAATPVGTTGIETLGGLQFGADGRLYGGGNQSSDGGNLYTIDTATGASTLIGNTGFDGVTGLTLVKDVNVFPIPEPATAFLGGLGLMALSAAMRRRRA